METDRSLRSTLDSICEVGYGVDFNCLEGSSEEGVAFMKAFDESNALIYWRLNDNEDILLRFLIESEKDPEQMNDKYLRDIVLNFVIAGKDTSASKLSWFLYMMCKTPVVQEKVAKEIRDVVGAKVDETNIDGINANITEATLEQMHHLHAALTETLRLYSAVPVVKLTIRA
ncbi:hypothetical protein TIFTF001_042413 [Ficus carica]|uniref:Cytochrome P450 n=1 Tax=Ficus carica TaxID=3494 RepID=A0AA87ZG72_FICCA|nr:hypothetical protein TIFTF001_042407 [Ficus carica]GMN36287.1 hypothetical protein TIFTF001_042409 [Ficus carica]GMN36299.1 hypothetical protein TIFTF001_042411 [Ficus carica]GMN36314.1 hypothetical protein TIFTF001_042413 [Ficus carica]